MSGNYDLTYEGPEVQDILDAGNKLEADGYIFCGVATPSTNPGTPTEKVYYLASQTGIYTNFGGITITKGLYVLLWNGMWTKSILQITDEPDYDDITDSVTLTNSKGINSTNGVLVNGSVASYSNYIDVTGYGYIRFTAILLSGNAHDYGIAFYDYYKNYIDGKSYTPDASATETGGYYMEDIQIPNNAVYARLTWWASSITGYSELGVWLRRDCKAILDELTLMPDKQHISFNNIALLQALSTYPLNNYLYTNGVLTLKFTTNTNQLLVYSGCLTIGENYKITVNIRKKEDLGGIIEIGSSFGTTNNVYFKKLSPTINNATYTFLITASSTDLHIGTPASLNKGETYYINSLTVENADGYITKAAEKINELGNKVLPVINDLQDYINKGGGDVYIPAGTYVCDNLTIPNGTRLHGIVGETTLKLTNGATNIINITEESNNIVIDGISFEGNADAQRASNWMSATTIANLRNRTGEGTTCGIYITGFAKQILIHNCEFSLFDMAGIHLYRTFVTGKFWHKLKITDCNFHNNFYGLLSDVRSEYHTIMGCSFNLNQVGAFVAGGNNTFSECRFEQNGTGFVISGTAGENDSHGSAGTCSFNHSVGIGIALIDVNNGYSFTGCHVFDGTGIVLSNSVGFNYVGGMIACKVIVDDERSAGRNMIADNIFTTTYSGGTIEGNPSRLSLHGNRFMSQDDSTAINNNV